MNTRVVVLASLLFLAMPLHAQTVFRSTQSANLPTAAMLPGGSWMFEISHRFDRPLSAGADEFWGVDGPAWIRLGLTFAPHERLMLSVLRTNFQDNVELNAKFRGFDGGSEALRYEVGAQGGVAWNTQVPLAGGAADDEMQAYVQLLVNALIQERVAIGLVPTFLRNPRILDDDPESTFVMGVHGQVYTEGAFSFFGEWIFSPSREDLESDGGTFGLEIRTRGHFFKLLATNNARINPTQFLGGSELPWEGDNLRFGFNITRLLPF